MNTKNYKLTIPAKHMSTMRAVWSAPDFAQHQSDCIFATKSDGSGSLAGPFEALADVVEIAFVLTVLGHSEEFVEHAGKTRDKIIDRMSFDEIAFHSAGLARPIGAIA